MNTRSLRSLARQLSYDHKNRLNIFSDLEIKQQAAVVVLLSKHVQSQLIKQLPQQIILPVLEALDPDDTTDLLQTLPKRKQTELITKLSNELKQKISLLLQFDPQTAAGLMSLNYIQVDQNQKMDDIGHEIQTHESRTGKLPVVLVMAEGKLAGFLPVRKMIAADPNVKAASCVQKIPALKHTAGFQAVIDNFIEHPHKKAVVLGDNDTILGVIYSDDVLRASHDREASSLYDFAGVSNEETVFGSIKQKVRFRYKWLIINLATAFIASFTVGLFNSTISQFVLLAAYMPIVAGMGGNAATQTLAVMVRGIALNQISLENAWPTVRREVLAALIHGLIIGILVAAVVYVSNQNIQIALILAFAMVVNLMVAGFFGTLVPLIMSKLGKDPATSATIFITTATDVLGFLVFLGMATLILR